MKQFYGEGAAFSAAIHIGIAAFAVFGLPHIAREIPDIPDIVPVEFVEIASETRSDKPAPEPEPEPEPEPAPQIAPEAPAPAPEIAEAVPLPEAKPEPARPEPEPEPTPPKPRIEVAPRAKPAPPSRFDASRVAALIDRSIKEEAPAPVAKPEEPAEEAAPQPSALSARIATATLQAAIRQRVQECWFVPSGAKDVADMQVRIRIQLREDGRLMRQPQFLDAGDLSAPGNEFFRIFAESARRAILNCQPYDNLPLAQYNLWRQIDFTFDAGQMLGG